MAEPRWETLVYSSAFCAVVAASVAALQYIVTGGVDMDPGFYIVAFFYFYLGRRSAVDGGR